MQTMVRRIRRISPHDVFAGARSLFSVPIYQARSNLFCSNFRFTCATGASLGFCLGQFAGAAVKQKILGHEYEEVIRDQHSEHGHLDLIFRQGKCIGLGADDILNTKPIPSTTATLYSWGWMCKKKNWLEGLAAMTMTEWNQDDRLLGDLGGGHAFRMGQRWVEHLGITWDDLPNWKAHREADKGHVDMFLPVWEEFGKGENEKMILQAAKESEELYRVYQAGLADAMERLV